MSFGKSVYQKPGHNVTPTTSPAESSEADAENGSNDTALGMKNISGPSSKLNSPPSNNQGLAGKSIPS